MRQTIFLLALGVTLGACADKDSSSKSSGAGGGGAPPIGLGGNPATGGLNNGGTPDLGSGGVTAGQGMGGAPLSGGAPTTGGIGDGGAPQSGGSGTGGAGLGGAEQGGASPGGAGAGGSAEGGDGAGGLSVGGAPSGGSGAGGVSSGGVSGGGASSGAGGDGGAVGGAAGEGPPSYALPPPNECSNQFNVQDCKTGDATSRCGGKCSNDNGPTAKNACESGKPDVPVQYACTRDILFSTEMTQAVIDDGYEGAFNYAIVGHDPDPNNLDAGLPNSCCQCYQLVFDVPTYLTASVLSPPPPLIVQSANTAASGSLGFDVFMGAGGLGAFNGCNAELGLASSQGYSMYTGYPRVGQAFAGGVKPGPDSVNCTDEFNNLTDALIDAASCQEKIETACNEITAANAVVQEDTRRSCIGSNQAATYYHENWNVYARRVACPTHLTEVTGCKPAPDSALPAPDPTVLTAAQAASAGFSQGYHTTTMQDCCMPTCAWANNVQIPTVDGYNSFYSCLEDGSVVTE